MRQLRLVGLAEDGASLVLESPTGESYRLPVDERVRAACRGDLTRLGQIEIEMDNPLRPREIQTRIRAGESAEEIAAASGMPLERVLRFAYAVLQERNRVVAQARSTPVRPRASEGLGERVEERLVSRGTDAGTLRWDAWRREDGRWAVRLAWRQGDRAHEANWSLDLARRTVQPEDPAAEQLSAQEFHARTITAVTPLAVAARPTGAELRRRPPEPAGPGPAPAVAQASPGPAVVRAEPDPAGSPSGDARPDEAATSAGGQRAHGAGPTVEEIRAGRPRPGSDRRADAAAPATAGTTAGGVSADGSAAPGRRAQAARTRTGSGAETRTAGTGETRTSEPRARDTGETPTGETRARSKADVRAAAGRTSEAAATGSRAGETPRAGGRTPEVRATGSRASETRAAGGRTPGVRAAGRTGEARRAGGRSGGVRGAGRDGDGSGRPDEDAGGEDPPAAEPRRVAAAGGGSIPLVEPDGPEDDRGRRATVPSWDDILLGVRRRH